MKMNNLEPDVHACILSLFSHVCFFEPPWTVACESPQSMGFSRQEFWSGLPCPSPDPRIRSMSLMSPVLVGGFLITNATWEGPRATYSNMDKSHKHNMSKTNKQTNKQKIKEIILHDSILIKLKKIGESNFGFRSLDNS